ncbi:NAD(P)/FAD-dependent oxidoreductase [Pelagicoccus sp. SDUM812002]|uniref:dihydrolipoyl dehydrogenase family protein n=1 Tax=Pelagicoccus sp. SDUM812002 TaxID=3041266 RepID=UPI00280DDFA4|nr:NAD(P)/FAD-dependent oxidoreductase [Pelagicoccus sp. SDUM812002]MDQ8184585.1 NAD(P)/FAD-dependent oxidoreductase [Pelagicoccus sp. SDUM812002]
MKDFTFDTVIVGSGTSAYYAARGLQAGGQKVAVVDRQEFGGTCALRGCQPKKYLVANAEAVASARHLVGKGIVASPQTNWAALQSLKNEFLDGIPEGSFNGYRQAGVTPIRGTAHLIDERTIQVDDSILVANHIIIATGSSPRPLDIPGAELAGTSDTFLELPSLPNRILFIGGGYISFEFAHVAAQAGSEVTILHRSSQPLKSFDSDAVATLLQATAASGIRFLPNQVAKSIEKTANALQLTSTSGSTIEADCIINASGRIPNLDFLDRASTGVQTTARGIAVNRYLQSLSHPNIYAIGDVADTGYQLATVADQAGIVAAENILHGNRSPLDLNAVASAVFTIPNLATVGLSEEEASSQGFDFRIQKGATTSWPSSLRIGESHSYFKVLIENESNRILGAHLLRHQAAEVINLFALAIKKNLTVEDLKSVLWAYPTYSSDLKNMIA